jgi:hypothetical protein
MYELFMWLDSIYIKLGEINPFLMLLFLLGEIAAGSCLGFLLAYIILKIDDWIFWHF